MFGPAPTQFPENVHAIQAIWDRHSLPPHGIDVIHTVRITGNQVPDIEQLGLPGLRAILLDAYAPDAFGGTGHQVDWDSAASIVTDATVPVILAGGLNAHNVQDAVVKVRPFGVDVSSGVEKAPRIKDESLIRQFVRNAKLIGFK